MALLCRLGFRNSFELQRCVNLTSGLGVRQYAASGPSKSKGSGPSERGTANVNVPGLSKKICDVPNTEVGPGASKNKEYKNPEYFCYNPTSYFEAEVEMLKYRCPQPSSKVPLQN